MPREADSRVRKYSGYETKKEGMALVTAVIFWGHSGVSSLTPSDSGSLERKNHHPTCGSAQASGYVSLTP